MKASIYSSHAYDFSEPIDKMAAFWVIGGALTRIICVPAHQSRLFQCPGHDLHQFIRQPILEHRRPTSGVMMKSYLLRKLTPASS